MPQTLSAILLLPLLLVVGCQSVSSRHWTAEALAESDGFQVPECTLPVDRGVIVSNIVGTPETYWSDDGRGYLSLLDRRGKVIHKVFLDKGNELLLHSPKGMAVLDGFLYFTDNARLLRCSLDRPSASLEQLAIEPATKLNDVAADDRFVWISDTAEGRVWRYDPTSDSTTAIPAPKGVNGVTSWRGKVFAVSWTEHDLYELDPRGENPPSPFGLAEHFTNLDGIEVLDDGTFLVSDFMGHKISLVSPNRKQVRTLIEIKSPADVGVDRRRGVLYVPQFKHDRIAVYRLFKVSQP